MAPDAIADHALLMVSQWQRLGGTNVKATRKDFKAIAAALKANRELLVDGKLVFAHETLCLSIANVLSDSNPQFDRGMFLRACGCEE